MKTYLDCSSGVAGDMLIAALIDLGLSAGELDRVLHRAVPLKGWRLIVRKTERHRWPARLLTVQGDRYFGSAERMRHVVRRSALPGPVKQRAVEIFARLQQAEKDAHGSTRGNFDRDGLGLLDTWVDVVGAVWGFWRLGISSVIASPVNAGRLAPATVQLLQRYRVPIYGTDPSMELATPTGVAILSVIAERFGPLPPGRLHGAGYGAGQRDIPDRANMVAIYRFENGSGAPEAKGYRMEPVLLLETVIDDMDPRLYPHVSDLVMKEGALDAWWVSAGMKKGRPGIAYTVLCRPEDEMRLLETLFRETTTLGVRRVPLERWALPRFAKNQRKIAVLPGGGYRSRSEYERVRVQAQALSIPLKKLLK